MNERAAIYGPWVCYGVIALMLLSLLFFAPARAGSAACACCAEPGTWYERTDRISDHELTELGRLRFDAVANTYLTEAGEDLIKGISLPSDTYSLTISKRQRGRWELSFRDQRNRRGTLTLIVPGTVVAFGADLHDSETAGGNGPLLYKELRLTGAVTGTGIFKDGMTAQTKFRLILQGRGNNCLDAEDFKNWTLQVFGPRASYSFYGSLKAPLSAQKS